MRGTTFSVEICSSNPWQNLAISSKVFGSAGMSSRKWQRSSWEFSLINAAILPDLAARSSYTNINYEHYGFYHDQNKKITWNKISVEKWREKKERYFSHYVQSTRHTMDMKKLDTFWRCRLGQPENKKGRGDKTENITNEFSK